MRLVRAFAALLLLATSTAPAGASSDIAVVIDGVGAAHGMGLAMDGVLGQARGGWPYRKILGLFYPGTTRASFKGTVRVGLATAMEHGLELPTGGEVSDAPPGGKPGTGFPFRVPAGATVTVAHTGQGYIVRAPGVVRGAQQDDIDRLPGTSPLPVPSGAPALPTPTPQPKPPSPSPAPTPSPRVVQGSIWVSPDGSPALTRVAATGRRYRGRIEIRVSESGLWAINHVDLETYVRGIAEEKGAGWPVEGLKVLAVAARSLAAATMTWYTRNQVHGFDICPSERCQVYLGYDGEEPSMTQATNATSGEVLSFRGRPILAMYHGNGGGRTEAYRLVYAGSGTDPYPYLSSVEYPFASPSRWQKQYSSGQVETALRAGGIAVRGRLTAVEVVQRGISPRVIRLRVDGAAGATEATGLAFQRALGLRSTWFDVRVGGPAPAEPDPIVPGEPGDEPVLAFASSTPLPRAAAAPTERSVPWRPDAFAGALLGFAVALLARASVLRGEKLQHRVVVGGVVHDVEVRAADDH